METEAVPELYGNEMMYETTDFSGAILAGFGIYMLVVLVFAVLMIVAMWKIFAKAGKPGWHSLIPFLNTYQLFKIAGKSGWMMLLLFVPFVNIVIIFMVSVWLAQAFGKSAAFGVFLLALFSPIGYLMLAFGNAQYQLGEESPVAPTPAMPTPTPTV